MLQFNYPTDSKFFGTIVSGDKKLSFRKFTNHDIDPVETRRAYIEELIANPTCDVHSGCVKWLGWELRFSHVKKFLVQREYGISLMYGFSVTQLRKSECLSLSPVDP